MKTFYFFGSRVVTHFSFWLIYYLVFGLIWAKNGDYYASYFLEFILLPVRILAVYFTIYTLIPKFLESRKIASFSGAYLFMLLLAGLLQRLFTYFFYEGFLDTGASDLFSLAVILRSIILINSTVLFVSAIKIAQLWFAEQDKNMKLQDMLRSRREDSVEIKAEKRTFKVRADEILYIEGLGNYVKVVLVNETIISYLSMRQLLDVLPAHFIRVHKSYIVNKNHIKSYNHEDVQVGDSFIPIGRSFKSVLNI
ncbi:MAG: LytTR family DNA-binding domain-containing protein [Bacteroidota bacterium]